jgi:hypothetical protein
MGTLSTLPHRVFWAAGAFAAAYALSAWSISQGGPRLEDFVALDAGRRHISAYFAVPVTGLALCVVAWSVLQARRVGGPTVPWYNAAEDGADRRFTLPVAVAFAVFALLPAIALVHLNRKVLEHGVVWSDALPAGASVPAGCLVPLADRFYCTEQGRLAAAVLRGSTDLKIKPSLWLAENTWDPFWARDAAGPQRLERVKTCGQDGLPQDERGLMVGLADRIGEIAAAAKLDAAAAREAITKRDAILAAARVGETLANCRPSEPLPQETADALKALAGGSRDRSDRCRETVTECRGVEWGPWSPWLLSMPTLAGLAGFGWMVAGLVADFLTRIVNKRKELES